MLKNVFAENNFSRTRSYGRRLYVPVTGPVLAGRQMRDDFFNVPSQQMRGDFFQRAGLGRQKRNEFGMGRDRAWKIRPAQTSSTDSDMYT